MIDSSIDRFLVFAERHHVALAVLGGAMFALSTAAYAGFVRLPAINPLTGMPAIIFSVVYNAAYWGFLYPKMEARRKLRQGAGEKKLG